MMASHTYGFETPVNAGTPALLGTPLSLAGTGSVTSASQTPADGAYQYLICGSRRTTTPPGTFTPSDSLGGAWTSLGRIDIDDGAGNFLAVQVFRQLAAGGARTVTVAQSSSNHLGVAWLEVATSVADASNLKSAFDNAGSPSVTLDSVPAASSVTLGLFATRATSGATVTPPTGWTELADWMGGTALRMEVVYRTGAAANAAAWATAHSLSLGWLLEVKGT